VKEIELRTWEEFESELKRLEDDRLKKKYSAKFLYRGQKDHSLNLSTTLERNGKENLSLDEYHHLIFIVKPQIESFTGTNWDILSYPQDIDKWLKDNDPLIPNAFGWAEFQNTYSYMAYLRHYGFPSPFLDWSNSPYIAAYFAFRQPSPFDNDVAIYAYLETTSDIGLRSASTNEPQIHSFGPFIRTDRRHFLQQSHYTICILRDDEWKYVSHEGAFSRGDLTQDVLWKFRIPHSERMKVLKLLDTHNINALSLFGDEESLMETMAFRGIHFRETDL
jgi:hypothetical protein